MAIFINSDSKVIVQGMTGSEGTKHTKRMLKAGTKVVGGVTPGKGGQSVDMDGTTLPVFNSVAEAMAATGANVTGYDIYVAPIGQAYSDTPTSSVTGATTSTATIQNVLNQSTTPSASPSASPSPQITTGSASIRIRRASVSTPSASPTASPTISNPIAPAGFQVRIVTLVGSQTVASDTNTTNGFQTMRFADLLAMLDRAEPFPSTAFGVGIISNPQYEQPLPPVRRANFCRAEKSRRNSVAQSVKVTGHIVKAER